jgi:hypothetical protein
MSPLAAPDELAEAWARRVAHTFERTVDRVPTAPPLLAQPTNETPDVATIDWIGLPARVVECLGRDRALGLLDWKGRSGDEGRRRLQEEYLEWRVVRSGARIERVELTTELGAYWRVLAAHDPLQTLDLVARFARAESVTASEVYGEFDPLGDVTPQAREEAFAATMLQGRSPYNNGLEAICCMVQPTNTLGAILELAVAAAGCGVVDDGPSGRRSMTCSEAIPTLGGAAEDGRTSDPLLVERIARLAFERRPVAFYQPFGIYIGGVEASRLQTPEGDSVPVEWFDLSRGLSAEESFDRQPRYQRLVFEVPGEVGLAVSDLLDVATEQPIRFGGQIAELVDLTLLLRVGERDPSDDQRETVGAGETIAERDCGAIERHYDQFELANG